MPAQGLGLGATLGVGALGRGAVGWALRLWGCGFAWFRGCGVVGFKHQIAAEKQGVGAVGCLT